MVLIKVLMIHSFTYIAHKKMFADPQSNKDLCYKGNVQPSPLREAKRQA